jgi:hypothetical protein
VWIKSDDEQIAADGVDGSRIFFGIADRFGNQRAAADGTLRVQHNGAGRFVGDASFAMNERAAGAVWLRSVLKEAGQANIAIAHPSLGRRSIVIKID